ncbi:MAG: alpha/beta fold hydrolase [Planctomycetes bacterium]|nr:alpha/beta fold hydrolase [Planctomycetota bacterium]
MGRCLILATFVAVCAVPVRADERPADHAAVTKAFVEALKKAEFEKATKDFDATMQKVSGADKLEEFWKMLTGQVGALKKTGTLRTEKKGKYNFVFVPCEFEKRKFDLKVVFDLDGKITGFGLELPRGDHALKPPPYARPESFREHEVTVGDGEWKLPGTLALPKGDGPFPAAVLVHGSGPHDRDETIGSNKPLRDLAWGLASRGIAVLRYEKRTHAHAEKMVKIVDKITIKEEVVDDAVAAVALLRKTEKIDPKKIFVIGHSLGAGAAPRVAEIEPAVAGTVLMAGNQRPLEDVLLDQVTYFFSLEKELTEARKKNLEEFKKQVARVKDPKLSPDTPRKDLPFGSPAAYWMALNAYDQSATAARLKQPVLVLQGERDYQVTMADFAGWKKVLAGKKNARLKSYADLNHLFIVGKGKSKPDEYEKAGHVDVVVIEDIAAWIKEH